MDNQPEKTVFVPRDTKAAKDMFQVGDVVGQYRIEKVLGQGGMGVVYLVQHTALKKHFALKALPAALARETSFVERFKREATTIARLKHPHIVNVTDFGESQGRLYLVLEYVDGGSLEEWFHRQTDRGGGGVPPAEIKRLMAQVLQGLAHAHGAGFIHRDLKPANVLLEKTGEAKISDFGLARAVAEEEYRRTGGTAAPFRGDSVTTTGMMVGTIDFMSPEARNMRPSDLRSDIYAIGVITYYLLTGKKPQGLAQPASKLVPGLDLRWDKFIATCLEEDPQKRYQNATAALEALQTVQLGGAKRGWLVPAIVAGALVAGIGAWLAFRPAPARVVENTPAVVAPPVAPTPETRKEKEPAPASAELRKFTLTGLPSGTVVTYREQNYTAGSTGRLILELPAGPQHVKARAPGYQDWEGEIATTEGVAEGTVPLEAIPPHPVRLTGLPAQARVQIDERTVEADATGAATVELRPGRYAVSATAPKYEPLSLMLDIQAATEGVALEMKKLPPPPEVLVALPDGSKMKFKWIPPGGAYLGSPADERGRQRSDHPRARAEIAHGFYMAETETTQRQHRALTGRNPSVSRALGDETRPVEQVAWRDLVGPGGALEKLNDVLRRQELPYRAELPTEDEWEYACRAGTDTALNNGSNLTSEREDPALTTLALYSGSTSHDAPAPVARHKPNAWGLYDMHGNIAEWTIGERGIREPVLRGGNWKVTAAHCRSASRVELTPETRPTDVMGYRLVLRPKEEP